MVDVFYVAMNIASEQIRTNQRVNVTRILFNWQRMRKIELYCASVSVYVYWWIWAYYIVNIYTYINNILMVHTSYSGVWLLGIEYAYTSTIWWFSIDDSPHAFHSLIHSLIHSLRRLRFLVGTLDFCCVNVSHKLCALFTIDYSNPIESIAFIPFE